MLTPTDSSLLFADMNTVTEFVFKNINTTYTSNMKGMFSYCSALIQLDLSRFSTSSVTDYSDMFKGCSSLENINLSGFSTSNANDFSEMFSGCGVLTELDLSCLDTLNVTNMSSMFEDCEELVTIYATPLDKNGIIGWSTAKVTNNNSTDMFLNCTKLVGGSGTVYVDSKTDKTYAVIDVSGKSVGYLTDIATR
jgi:surface protein